MKKHFVLTTVCMWLMYSPASWPKPPQQAIDACHSKTSGEICSMQTPHGRLSGSCQKPPHESLLICIPTNHSFRQNSEPSTRSSAQNRPHDQPRTRKHTRIQSDGIKFLMPAVFPPITQNQTQQIDQAEYRILTANGVPKHHTGNFPNSGNPHLIKEQHYHYRVPANPKQAVTNTPLGLHNFGIAVNGVPFDPVAAEWYRGQRGSQWQYEALSGAVVLGIDENHAHVQHSGAYHYHGLPKLLLSDLGVSHSKHSPLIGWAADGFPIYALYGYANKNNPTSGIATQTSSYRLKPGTRPTGNDQPGGYYDGTFVADYQYVAGAGTLDECNGRFGVTPEFPAGSYAYFLTEKFPFIPRCFKGTVSRDFLGRR